MAVEKHDDYDIHQQLQQNDFRFKWYKETPVSDGKNIRVVQFFAVRINCIKLLSIMGARSPTFIDWGSLKRYPRKEGGIRNATKL